MEELFRSYWWLVFPLSWIVFGASRAGWPIAPAATRWSCCASYAEAGREPPPELLAR
jgi:hypothetical protein